jgi:hypothetical protein
MARDPEELATRRVGGDDAIPCGSRMKAASLACPKTSTKAWSSLDQRASPRCDA